MSDYTPSAKKSITLLSQMANVMEDAYLEKIAESSYSRDDLIEHLQLVYRFVHKILLDSVLSSMTEEQRDDFVKELQRRMSSRQ